MVVSNGSYFSSEGIGAAGWYIESSNGKSQINSTTPTTGPPSIQSPYRSKLTGILGAICHISQLCNNNQIIFGGSTLYYNGEGAIKATEESYDIVHSNRNHFDFKFTLFITLFAPHQSLGHSVKSKGIRIPLHIIITSHVQLS